MFVGTGEYYCINGGFSYPPKMDGIKSFLENLTDVNRIEEVTCYDVNPCEFVYETAMDDGYRIVKGELSLLETATLIDLDFYYGDLSCRLLVQFLDEQKYCVSLVYSAENIVSEDRILELKKHFYSALKPIYGNDGIEKSLF